MLPELVHPLHALVEPVPLFFEQPLSFGQSIQFLFLALLQLSSESI